MHGGFLDAETLRLPAERKRALRPPGLRREPRAVWRLRERRLKQSGRADGKGRVGPAPGAQQSRASLFCELFRAKETAMATSKPVVRQVDMEARLRAPRPSTPGRSGQADMLEFALTRTMRAPACLLREPLPHKAHDP